MTESNDDRTVYGGYGWVENTSDAGYVAVAPGGVAAAVLPVAAQRSMVLDDVRTRRELAELEVREEVCAERNAFYARQLAQSDVRYANPDWSLAGALSRASKAMAIADVQAASSERHELERLRAEVFAESPEERVEALTRAAYQRTHDRQVAEEIERVRAARAERAELHALVAIPRDQPAGYGFVEEGRQPW
jgi:hypothetical protein